MKIENLSPGQTVYEVSRYKMGNTTISTVGTCNVEIVSVNLERQSVEARVNGNRARTYYRRAWSKWRATQPLLVKNGMGLRLATRAEIKAAKEKKTEP